MNNHVCSGALEGREYSFEKGQDGLIECSPPNNVISTTFKQGTKQLFIGIKSQNATPIMESRFVLNDYSYRNEFKFSLSFFWAYFDRVWDRHESGVPFLSDQYGVNIRDILNRM